MIVRKGMRNLINFRKQAKNLSVQGYKRIEAEWRLHRGGMIEEQYKIEDVKISTDGKYIYYKLNQACNDYEAKYGK